MNPWLNTAALHHYSFEAGFPLNVIVTLVYWAMLHEDFAENPTYAIDQLQGVRIRLVHAFPLAFFVLNWLISDVVMPSEHIGRTVTFSISYLLINYLYVQHIREEKGKALYDFLDWDADFSGALVFGTAMIFIVALVFWGLAKLTYLVKADFVA